MIKEIHDQSTEILHSLYGGDAVFREGQYEAIEATLTHRRTLVVQKTGWGKSLVYFVCTKILRNQGKGVTMVVSPLLVLMENQFEAAQKLGLHCEIMNSTTKSDREEQIQKLKDGAVDIGKIEALVFDASAHFYRVVGEKVGNAFRDGMALK